jgi:UDP-N-acetylglucosamine 4,6-dehydratase/5-epimerase
LARIFITGGTGSWGVALAQRILVTQPDAQIVVYSRSENRQSEMSRRFNDARLSFVIGDVRDSHRLSTAMRDVDIVYHLAAMKHVPICELHPEEVVKTNILGTMCAIDAALENDVARFVLASTDKAVAPINAYGASKSIAEKLVIAADRRGCQTVFSCVRSGNVLGSSGSVVPLFCEQLLRANVIAITDPKMTRFLARMADAVSLLLYAGKMAHGGEIFVTRLPSVTVQAIADVMLRRLGDADTRLNLIGIRPGEKLHEVLVASSESRRAFHTDNAIVILPATDTRKTGYHWEAKEFLDRAYDSANNVFLTAEELESWLASEGWLDRL